MIAIYDEEFATAKRGLPPPSLAAMKTSAYLKTEQDDLVILITDLTNAANYKEVYFFSDKPLEELPKEITNEFGLPFLLKPRRSYASKGIEKIYNEEDFSS